MKNTIEKGSQFATSLYELEEVKKDFLWLIYEISESDWDRKMPGQSWTAKEEMVHIVQALEVIPKGIRKAIKGSGRSVLALSHQIFAAG